MMEGRTTFRAVTSRCLQNKKTEIRDFQVEQFLSCTYLSFQFCATDFIFDNNNNVWDPPDI